VLLTKIQKRLQNRALLPLELSLLFPQEVLGWLGEESLELCWPHKRRTGFKVGQGRKHGVPGCKLSGLVQGKICSQEAIEDIFQGSFRDIALGTVSSVQRAQVGTVMGVSPSCGLSQIVLEIYI
jgi:hypothetical protein